MKRKRTRKQLSLWGKVKNKLISAKNYVLDRASHCLTCDDFWTNVLLVLFGISLLCPAANWVASVGWLAMGLGLIRIHRDCWDW